MSKSIQQIIDEERKKSRLNDVSEATINRALANEWKRNDQEFSNTMRQISAERNDEYYEKLHTGIANRDNTYQAECNARPEVKAKISQSLKGKLKSDEHNAKVAAKNKERSKPIMTPWGEFESRKAAVVWALENTDIVNVDKKIQKWVKTPGSGYYYV
jgi:hypothetical protein